MLNEIISSIDDLLYQVRFHCIEKIKTIGATYMACSGLRYSFLSVNRTLCLSGARALELIIERRGPTYDRMYNSTKNVIYTI